jgi:hypothetical protein
METVTKKWVFQVSPTNAISVSYVEKTAGISAAPIIEIVKPTVVEAVKPAVVEAPKPAVVEASKPAVVEASKPVDPSIPTGSKNGHKVQKVRDLLDHERDILRGEFLYKNGITNEDDCVAIREDRMGPEVAIFQVTGFFTYLHAEVAKGKLTLKDMPAYLDHLMSMRALYARYNSPKYVAMRQNILLQGSKNRI